MLDIYCKKSALLKLTLERLHREPKNQGRSAYVCCILNEIYVAEAHAGDNDDARETYQSPAWALQNWIRDMMHEPINGSVMLEWETTYQYWIRTHHPELGRKMQVADYLQGRIEWVQWMIWYWECRGE